MNASARFLDNYVNPDTFDYSNQLSLNTSASPSPGSSYDIYIQVIDLSKDRASQGYVPAGRRITSATGLQVTFASINVANICTYYASAAAPSKDASIWKVTVPAADFAKLRRGTISMYCQLTLATQILLFTVPNAINIIPQNDY
jgi:hypothetical protein